MELIGYGFFFVTIYGDKKNYEQHTKCITKLGRITEPTLFCFWILNCLIFKIHALVAKTKKQKKVRIKILSFL